MIYRIQKTASIVLLALSLLTAIFSLYKNLFITPDPIRAGLNVMVITFMTGGIFFIAKTPRLKP